MSSPAGEAKSLPLYIQISELLTREIAAGHWLNGERLPTEVELAQKLGVAVGTLRKALADLESRGMLERRQGSGTYVRVPSGDRSVYELFRLELLQGGGLPSARVLALQRLRHPAAVPVFGAAEADTRHAYRVRRLRLLNRVPIALEEIWFDSRHADARLGRPLRVADLNESLYYFYQHDLGFWIAQVEDHIGMGQVPDWSPPDFALPTGAPTCLVERRSLAPGGELEEFSRTWIDPGRVRYTARWR